MKLFKLISKTLSLILLSALSLPLAYAQPQLSGNLSGTLGPGTFVVIGNIQVQDGDSLTIQAGTNLLFNGNYNFVIEGFLQALGTVTDSVIFKPNTGFTNFGGISFNGEGTLNYCVVKYSASAGISSNSAPLISHSTIADNLGHGLYFAFTNGTVIDSCDIMNNTTTSNGGGICLFRANVIIKNSYIHNNFASGSGGALWTDYGVSLYNCIISYNYVNSSQAGGIHLYNDGFGICSFNLSNCIIKYNEYAGVYCHFHTLEAVLIQNCDIYYNGSGIILDDNNASFPAPIIKNNILNGNSFYGIRHASFSSVNPQVIYNDIYNNTLSGSFNPGTGVINTININGDSCDTYHNIFLNPQFVIPTANNFNLQANSPCIDAGSPLSPPDPDGTIADMGVFYYDQGIPQVTIALNPINPPIILPATGGTFRYIVTINNLEITPRTFSAWTSVTLPTGNIVSPILLRTLTLNPG
jgi:hypothetical protein